MTKTIDKMIICSITCEPIFDKGIDAYKRSAVFAQVNSHSRCLKKFHVLAPSFKSIKANATELSETVSITTIPARNMAHFLWKTYRTAKSFCDSNQIEGVTAENPFLAALAGHLLASGSRRPLGIEVHGEYIKNAEYSRRRRFGKLIDWIAIKMLRRANAIRTVSLPQTDKLVSLGFPRERISHVPCGVDTKLFETNDLKELEHQERIGVLFAGRLEEQKNPDGLIEIARQLKKTNSRLRLWIYGDGTYLFKMKQTSDSEKLPIDFFGFVGPEELRKGLRSCLAVVLTSFYEGTARIILEGFACGRPCVVSDIPENCSVVQHGENGYCLASNDIQGYVDKLHLLHENQELYSQIVANCLTTASCFSREKTLPKYLEYYKLITRENIVTLEP